jgi:hypothetical protein
MGLQWWRKLVGRKSKPSRPDHLWQRAYRPRLEKLEDRWMLNAIPLIGANFFDNGPGQTTTPQQIVQVTPPSPTNSQNPQATILLTPQGSILTGIGITFPTTEGTSFSGNVANFTDTNPADPATAFTATITWGDGTTGIGTVSGGNGSFSVSGTHTFADEGSLPVAVTLTQNGTSNMATANSTANTAENDALTGASLSFSLGEGNSVNGTVATFSDTNAANVASDFSAIISWGDGSTSTGTVNGANGSFTVSGTHTYTDEGADPISVSVADDGSGTATLSAIGGTATVAESDSLTGHGATISATQNQSFTATVATFTDTNVANIPGDFTATINWGDGTTSLGTVTGGNGTFSVSGTHTYASIMSFAVSVVMTDDGSGTATATANSTAIVTEALTVTTIGIAPTEGTGFSGNVATFSDSDTALMASDFTSTIIWGDGTTSSGTISGNNGSFTVAGTHTYSDEGTGILSVLVQHATAMNSSSANITIAEGDTLGGSGVTLSGTETGMVSGTIANFTDTNTFNVSTDFTAIISWGDGTTSTGTVSGGNGAFAVAGSHVYGDEGTFTASVTLTDDGTGTATFTANSTVTIPEADSLTGTGTTFSAPEGTSFTQTVATFTDTNLLNVASDFTAAITWGDGTTSTGTVTGGNGTFTVTGTHTYNDETSFAVGVTLIDNGTGTAMGAAGSTANATENDTLGVGTLTPITANQGQSFTATVATFTDTNLTNTLSDFTATITWGDGTTSTGTITGGNGSFSVTGTHTYSVVATFSIMVTLADDAPGSAKATATNSAVVSEVLTVTGVSFTPTEGTSFSGTVATFTDSSTNLMPTDFTATINWGDGTTSLGTVTGANGSFTVTGTHTYGDEGPNAVAVTVTHAAAMSSATTNITSAEGDVLSGTGNTLTTTETGAVSGTIATFTDKNTFNVTTDFSAVISWGDGTTSTGTITGGNGSFAVGGSHTYGDEGSFTVSVTFVDDSPGTASISASSTVTIPELDSLTATGTNFSTPEGTSFTQTVATFTDTNTANVASDFTATITWGDGTTSAGTVGGGNGSFTVTGTHTYSDENGFAISVSIADDGSGTATGAAGSTANVTENDTLAASGTQPTINASQGVSFTTTVASFTDTNAANISGDFTASINWGDGTTSTGTVSGGNGSFSVTGTHTYSTIQTFTIMVTLNDDAPGSAMATATNTVVVSETLTVTPVAFTPTEGTSFSGTVATFTDAVPGLMASDFTATITWGDGTTSSGTIGGGNGSFTVTGTHTYSDEGAQPAMVSVARIPPGTASGSANNPTTVAEADSLTATPVTFAPGVGTSFTGTVAMFTDTLTTNVPGDFTATINWGDGTTSTGTVTGSNGSFIVTGTHTYSTVMSFTVAVTLTDDGTGTATATANSTANVSETLIVTPVTFTPTEGTSFSGTVATFTDAAPGLMASDFTATITWGDGTTSSSTIGGSNGSFTVTGTHTYSDEGSESVTVAVSRIPPGTAMGTSLTTISVAEGDALTASPVTFSVVQGTSFTSTVGTFSDTLLTNTSADFTATITWGDGTTSTGTVSGSNGVFTVTGTHTYSTAATFTVAVTLTDDGTGTATATANSTIVSGTSSLTGTGTPFTSTEGTSFTGTVATFSDSNTADVASQFTATINWGDGTTSTGVVGGGNATFTVTGTHTYGDEASAIVAVTLTQTSGGTAMATANSTATVGEGDVLTAGTAPVSTGTEGTSFTGTVATFTDTLLTNVASDFTAVITWEDGTTSAGTVTGANGSFSVTGTHTFSDEGSLSISVTVTDDAPGTATLTATSTATVAEGDVLTAGTGTTLTATEGTSVSNVTVATFTDSLTTNVASDFAAVITWGDGTTSAGTVTGSNGSFSVTGTHSFSDEGSLMVSVAVTDDGSGTAMTTVTSTATVAEADSLTAAGTTFSASVNQPFTSTVATFTDTLTTNVSSDFLATITWGDGTTSTGSVTGSNGSFSVSGTHTYSSAASFMITVTVTDDGMGTATATANSTANVSTTSETLTVSAVAFTPTEGTSFSGTVGTFTDSITTLLPTDFTATITWGDGTTSSGTIAGSNGSFTVTGTHTYSDEGSQAFSVTVSRVPPGTATGTGNINITAAEGDALTASPVTFSVVQGTSFTSTVGTFSDSLLTNVSGDFTATITWGDGTTSTGTVGGSNGVFTVTGTHTYSTAATFTVAVTLTDDGSGTATATANSMIVSGTSSLTGTGIAITATEGTALSTGTVATFTDSNTADVASQFTATITWGDGTTSTGTVTGGNGSFSVTGTHTYSDEGSFVASVTLTQTSGGTATASANSTASVAEADSLTAAGTTFNANLNQPFTTTVATFTDTLTTNVSSDFLATITWGDGTTGTGTVTGSNGSFSVSGSHTYSSAASFMITVTIADDGMGTASATAHSTANVSTTGETLIVNAVAFTPTEGTSFSGTVASFTDTITTLLPSDFTATITWGDGTSSTGTIAGSNGSFTVSGAHTYTDEGSEPVMVTVTRTPPGTTMGTSNSTTTVAEGDKLTGTGVTFTIPLNTSFTNTVATFPDTNLANFASDFTATINWGDTTTSAGVVTGGSNGIFTVTGTHTYTVSATFPITVTLTDDGSGTATATANGTAVVGTSSLTGTGTPFTSTEGTSFTGTVASFTDSITTDTASQFTATIAWGDGTTSTGTVSGGNGTFTVTGTHTYSDEGPFVASVTLTQTSGGSAKASANSTATVAEGDTLSVVGTSPLSATEGTSFSGTVANFADTLKTNVASDFTAVISWGDGTTSTGTVTGANGTFTVTGTHTYKDEATLTATVTLTDDGSGTATATATDAATVAEGDTLTPNPATITTTEGTSFSGTVATFTDSNTTNVGSDFTATITWGDGTTSTGIVTGGGGLLTVIGTHTYSDEGSFTVTVSIADDGTGTATSSANSTATVNEGDVLTPNPITFTVAVGTSFTGTVATFTDTNLTNVPSDFIATISWGDASFTNTATITGGNGTFIITGTHTYASQGTFMVNVTLTEDTLTSPLSSTANSTAIVGTSSLIGTGTPIAPTEGTSFTGTVATFADSNTADVASQFTATITWGDGTTSTGTVTGGNGSFTVTGSHTYADEGSFSVSATLAQNPPGTAKATTQSTATVGEGDMLSGTATTIAGTEGQSFTGTLATFTTTFTSNVASDFTATITWGDGSTSAGTVTGGNGTFTVSGTHTFTDEGALTTVVTLIDNTPGTATATAQGTANVVETDVLTAVPATITPTEGLSFSGTVASFTDTNTTNVGSDFTATINWGDGTSSVGTVTGGNGTLVVLGTHTYMEEGTNTITVMIAEDGSSTVTQTATSAGNVADAALTITSLIGPSLATLNVPFTGTVASFTDANPLGTVSDFTAVISWGDGTTSAGTITSSNGTFSVSGSHTYTGNATSLFSVTVRDVGGATATSSTQLPPQVGGLIPSFLGDI